MNDLKFAIRQLLKNPGFTVVAVLTLALGIGANTAIFSLVNSILIRTVSGVREPARLLAFDFKPSNRPTPIPIFSYPDFLDFQQGTDVFDGMAASRTVGITVGAEEQAEKTQALLVTPNWFRFLGVRTIAGRAFAEDEGRSPGRDPVVVISEAFWRRRYNSDPTIVGQSIRLNDHSFTVIGVAASFRVGLLYSTPEIWGLLSMHAQLDPDFKRPFFASDYQDMLIERRMSSVTWIARLKTGLSIERARAAVERRSRQLGELYGQSLTVMGQYPLTVLPQVEYNRRQMDELVPVGMFLMALAALVLVIACANLANLLLARATRRSQEIAVRLALGAGRPRLIRQLLTEGLLLSLLGAAAGLLLSGWTGNLISRVVGEVASRGALPMRPEVNLDWNVLNYALLISFVAALVFALAPALRASRLDLVAVLKGERGLPLSRSRRLNFRSVLVVGQVAVCFLLLTLAGLFTRALSKARNIDLGFRPEGVLTMRIDLDSRKIPAVEARGLYDRISERLNNLPGVREVSFAKFCQGDENTITGFICEPLEAGGPHDFTKGNVVSLGYFETIGTPILRGRDFSRADLEGPPVLIVNETFARRLWPAEDAIGKSVKITEQGGNQPGPVSAEVVGIAKDGQYVSLFQNGRGPFIYRPYSPRAPGSLTLLVRVDGDPRRILPTLRSELRAIDSRLPIYDLKRLADGIVTWRLGPQLMATLVSALGLLGLFLAALGVYGVLAYLVSQRTKEFGIRLALGAQRVDVILLVVRQGFFLILIGSAIGLAAAVAGTRVISHLLFGVSPLDFAAFVAGALVLGIVGAVACYLPSRRATKIDPIEALRWE